MKCEACKKDKDLKYFIKDKILYEGECNACRIDKLFTIELPKIPDIPDKPPSKFPDFEMRLMLLKKERQK